MLAITSRDLSLKRRQPRVLMAAPVDPAALANALQSLTAVLQNLQDNPPVAPAAAAHVNILDAFDINPGINLRAAVINSNVSVSPRRYYHTYGDIVIHTTTSHTNVRVYNHE